MKRRSAVLLAVVAAGGMIPMAAAQESAPQAASPVSGDVLQEIVVTAQKRAQRLEDVPVAMTALTTTQLEQSGITNIQDLGQVTPGLIITRNSAQSAPVIRGITSTLAGPGSDPAVATYIDGFYQPSKTANVFDFNNIRSVEVLKGPQGTLFGRNATGGALLINTLDPSFDTHFSGSVGYARFDEKKVSAYVTTGLTDRIATDLSFYYKKSDGYIDDFQTGDPSARVSQLSMRSKTIFEATDDLRFTLELEHNKIKDPTPLVYPIANGLGNLVYAGLPHATEPHTSSLNKPTIYSIESNAAYLKAEADLGVANLTSFTGYRDQDDLFDGELGGFPRPLVFGHFEQPQQTFTQEFNLNSTPGGSLDWVIGLFYLHDKTAYENFSTNGAPPHGSHVTTDAYAGFADGTYAVTDRLSLSAGLRYSWEERRFIYGVPADGPLYLDTNKSWDSFTPRAVVQYELADRTNIYGSFSKGFKSGSFNAANYAPDPVDPEEVTAFEVGFKTASSIFRFDASAFHYDYSNLQLFISNFSTGSATSILVNAGKAEIYGADAQLSANLSENLDVNVGFAWTHARYKSFTDALDYEVNPATGTLRQVLIDASGNRMPRAPDYTVNVGGEYRIPLTAGTIGIGGNAAYRSSVVFSPGERLHQDGYMLVNARLSFQTEDERWKVTVYGNNLTDKTYMVNQQSNALGDALVYGEPMTYGVTLGLKF